MMNAEQKRRRYVLYVVNSEFSIQHSSYSVNENSPPDKTGGLFVGPPGPFTPRSEDAFPLSFDCGRLPA